MQMQGERQIKQIVGDNIRARRDELGLTRLGLSREAGSAIDPVSIYKWERGMHRPSDENLRAIARVLDRDYAWFFTDRKAAA